MGGELPHFIQEILSVIWKNVTEILSIEEEILAMRWYLYRPTLFIGYVLIFSKKTSVRKIYIVH